MKKQRKRGKNKLDRPDHEPWHEEFKTHVGQSNAASRALVLLLDKGCSYDNLTALLHLAAGRVRTDHRAVLRDSGWTEKRLRGLSSRLRGAAREIESVNSACFRGTRPISRQGENCVDNAAQSTADPVVYVFLKIPLLLRIYDQFLFNRKGLPNERDAGNDFLVELAEYVKSKTGETHYGEIAFLMEAAVAGYGKTVDITPQSVARKCQRYKKKYPGLADPFLTLETPSR